MTNKVMVLVPNFIAEVLRRNRLPLATILDYPKLRSLMSVQDVSAFLSLQRADKIDLLKTTYNSFLLTSWEQNRTSDEKAELDSVVVPLSHSEVTVNDLYESLSDKLIESSLGTEYVPYEIVDFSKDVFALVLKPGFLTLQKSNTASLELTRGVLKVFYEYLHQHEVHSLAIFKEYLRLLEESR